MLIIHSPKTYIPERDYIYKVIFQDFWSIPYTVVYEDRQEVEIRWKESDNGRLRVADVFLQSAEHNWMKISSLPVRPLAHCEHAQFGTIPVLYGKLIGAGGYFTRDSESSYCGIDIFGSAFFMLSRYEECVLQERDHLERFSAKLSLAYQENFLHRPIINEYLEILWGMIMELWPQARRRPRQSRFFVSHDVDWPFFTVGKNKMGILKEAVGDLAKRRNFYSAYQKGKMLLRKNTGDLTDDPYNTFRWIMDQSEKAGIRSSFYFITQETLGGLDGNYTMHDSEIQKLLREIHSRGHEIGLHPSFHTYKHPERIKHQFDILLNAMRNNRIHQEEWGGRQHYLRWMAPDTWQFWEDAGLQYDSTLSYADCSGFRCGICYEYPVYNLKTRKQLKLRERPLIIMDQTILQKLYMGLRGSKALNFMRDMYSQCRKFNGDFTLLWHNYRFINKEDRELYQGCMEFMKII